MSFKRSDRVSEAIKREISVLILHNVKDPDVAGITVMDVQVADDLRHAKVFVSVYGSAEDRKRTLEGLGRAKGFLRAEVAKRLQLRYAPELHFALDETLDHAMRIEELLHKIKEKDPNSPVEDAPEAELEPEDP